MSASLLLRRFHAQHLSVPALRTPAEVVAHLCAVQSQDYLGAKWSVGQRMKRGVDADIDRAMAEGTILRTHILRPTWHFVTPADIGWMLELTAPQVRRLNVYVAKRFDVNAKLLSRSLAVVAASLEGGKRQTREELSAVLSRAKLQATGIRMAYVMMEGELTGLLCSGALKGKKQTYALLSERAPKPKKLGREEATAELLRRYFVGHTPSTLKQFCWWSGLSVKESKAALAEVRKEFEVERVGGVEWFSAQRKGKGGAAPRAWFIPEYDEALVGSPEMGVPRIGSDRRAGRPTRSYDRPIIINGRWAGTWKREFEGKGAVLLAELFGKVTGADRKALEKETKEYGRFLGIPVKLTTS
jgi:hypothetical protein